MPHHALSLSARPNLTPIHKKPTQMHIKQPKPASQSISPHTTKAANPQNSVK